MKTRLLVILSLAAALLSLAPPAGAQAEKYELETAEFQILDKFDRPYVPEPNTVWVGVRLSSGADRSPSLNGLKQIEAQGIEYRIDDDSYQSFAVVNGVARLSFVIFKDKDRNPIGYDVVLLKKDGNRRVSEPLRPHHWRAGAGAVKAVARASSRAPGQQWEWLFMAVFVLLGLLLVHMLFARSIFWRSLFHRRREVSAALVTSNVLFIVGVLALVASCAAMTLHPQVMWGSLAAPYVVYGAVFLVFLFVIYLIAFVATRE